MLLEHFHHIFFICPISLFFVDITLLFFTYVHSFCFLWILHFCFFHMSILSVFCGYYVFVFYICPFTSFFRTVCFCFSQSTAHCLTMTSHCLAMKFQIFQTATNKPRMPVDTRGLATYLTIRFYFFITLSSFLSENGIYSWVAGLFRSIMLSKISTLRWAIRSYCWQIVTIFGL